MVQIEILASDMLQSKQIAEFLLKEKLIIDVCITENQDFIELRDGELTSSHKVLLTGKTKALLFQDIDNKIKERYAHNMPLVWSLAITHMDWEQSEYLIKHTASV
ncbi:MAG: divalent cation tolerance protein CutA [Flavobacteriales bacterium]